jgi:hypothetical protein
MVGILVGDDGWPGQTGWSLLVLGWAKHPLCGQRIVIAPAGSAT